MRLRPDFSILGVNIGMDFRDEMQSKKIKMCSRIDQLANWELKVYI